MKTTTIVSGMDLGDKIAEALGYDPHTIYRIIVDCRSNGDAAKVYIETYATEQMLDLDWSRGLEGASIEVLDATEEHKAGKEGR